MSTSVRELYESLVRVGVEKTASLGLFHSLPYGGGSSGSGVKVYRSSADLSPPTGSGLRAMFDISEMGLTEAPFLLSTVLNPVGSYGYMLVSLLIDPTLSFVEATYQAVWMSGGPPSGNYWDVDIGLKVEPFVMGV